MRAARFAIVLSSCLPFGLRLGLSLGLSFGAMAKSAHADAKQNASCAGCHPDIASEWTQSLHRASWKDPVFKDAYAVEPLAFCRGCHAPESDAARLPDARAQAVGVGCTTCHGNESAVHATKAAPTAEHTIVVDATLATSQACAKCHEFDFPAGSHQVTPQPMQETLAEHASSDRATTPCQGCHMPIVDGPDGKHRSHSFAVLASPAMLKSAVTVSAERVDDHTLRVTLRADRVGHSFPTGDMFRRLEVRAQRVDDQGRVVAEATPITLSRRFEDRPRDPGGKDLTFMRVEAEDTRVPAPGRGDRVVELSLRGKGNVVWSVVYQRMSTPMAEAFGVSQVLDEVELAHGTIAPPRLALNTTGGTQ